MMSCNFYGKCQFCFTKGHSLTSCYTFKKMYPQVSLPSLPKFTTTNHNFEPQTHVMTATNNTSNNPTWLFDSGASHHVTNDLNALSLHTPYDGTDELVIGDGSCLPITHVGTLIIYFENIPFKLTNVLCVPSLSRNIISISRLCLDNQILIQFFSYHFVIKDFHSHHPLLHGTSNRGLYQLRSTASPSVFHMQKNKGSNWHHRLGHPHSRVLSYLSSIVSSISKYNNSCNSCC